MTNYEGVYSIEYFVPLRNIFLICRSVFNDVLNLFLVLRKESKVSSKQKSSENHLVLG